MIDFHKLKDEDKARILMAMSSIKPIPVNYEELGIPISSYYVGTFKDILSRLPDFEDLPLVITREGMEKHLGWEELPDYVETSGGDDERKKQIAEFNSKKVSLIRKFNLTPNSEEFVGFAVEKSYKAIPGAALEVAKILLEIGE
jgi:hypothetical protein